MGKSPGKWIKTLLFGKKTSKSDFSKRTEKVANDKAVHNAAKASEANLVLEARAACQQAPNSVSRNEGKNELQNTVAQALDREISLQGNQDPDSHATARLTVHSADDTERMKQEQAAMKAQAAFRGYLARRAFRALKGIIRLQALIRGHLVRRQAISTLRCMLGIVKFQAIVRGVRFRSSNNLKGHETFRPVNPLAGRPVDPTGIITYQWAAGKLSTNAFLSKLHAFSSTPMPLFLQYESGEPNSVFIWLERWSLYLLKPVPLSKKVSDSKSQRKHRNLPTIEDETSRPRRSVWRIPPLSNGNVLTQSISESEKSKHSIKTVSSDQPDSIHEHPQNELEKVKRSLRKVRNPTVQGDTGTEKPKKEIIPVAMNEAVEPLCKDQANLGESRPVENVVINNEELISKKDENSDLANQEESNSKKDSTNNESQKSRRRASLPSYMAATESAKAKLRLQGSPRFDQNESEKNNNNSLSRRHSLPTLTNEKVSSMSPRAQKLVQATGKGGNKSDRSLLTSRDGNAKVIQAEWRR